MRYVLIPGRHPELSRAEIEAVLERDGLSASVVLSRDDLILLEALDLLPPDLPAGLGGMVKWGEVVGETSSAEWQVVKTATEILERLAAGARGKFEFGLSFYDSPTCHSEERSDEESQRSFAPLRMTERVRMTGRLGLTIKKNLKAAGIASRWVQSREKTLSSVVVKMNHLTDRGVELCFFRYPHLNPPPTRGRNEEGVSEPVRYLIARTTAVQAFDEFSFRDYGRPSRDIKSGMIPVKLARMLVNLSRTPTSGTLLDPFCGSGTVLTEAAIMGFREVIGNDMESRAIESSAENLAWVREHVVRSRGTNTRIVQGPAEKLDLTLRGVLVDGIATEPYLGPPLLGGEREQDIQSIKKELEEIYRGAFRAFTRILRPGGHVAIIFPVFRRRAGDVHIDVLDDIQRLGFTPLPLEKREMEGVTHDASSNSPHPSLFKGGGTALVYSRPDQRVIREIRVFRYGF